MRFLWNRTKTMSMQRMAITTRAELGERAGGPARGFCGDMSLFTGLYGGLQALPHLDRAKYQVGDSRHEVDLVIGKFARHDRLGVEHAERLLPKEYGIGVHGLY